MPQSRQTLSSLNLPFGSKNAISEALITRNTVAASERRSWLAHPHTARRAQGTPDNTAGDRAVSSSSQRATVLQAPWETSRQPRSADVASYPRLASLPLICSVYARELLFMVWGRGHNREGRRRTKLKESSSRQTHDMTDSSSLSEVGLPTSIISPKATWLECQMQNQTRRTCMRLVHVNHGALLWALGTKEKESR